MLNMSILSVNKYKILQGQCPRSSNAFLYKLRAEAQVVLQPAARIPH